MASRAAAGSTITYGATALGEVESISAAINGDEVDVTRLGALRAEFDVGQSDLTVDIEVTGAAAHSLVVGGTPADIVIDPNDGSSNITLANMIVTAVGRGFPKRGEITSTVRFRAAYTSP